MHVKVVYDLPFNIWAKGATISGTFRSYDLKIVIHTIVACNIQTTIFSDFIQLSLATILIIFNYFNLSF